MVTPLELPFPDGDDESSEPARRDAASDSERRSGFDQFRDDRRGVSKALGYILGIMIVTLLMSGLIIATSDVVDDAADRGTESEMQVAGDQLAGTIMELDRLADGETNATVRTEVQPRAGGTQYRIFVDGTDGDETLRLESSGRDVTVEVPLRVTADLQDNTVVSGELYVVLRDRGSGPEIHVVTEEGLDGI